MWHMLWPLLVIVGSNCLYHICAKSGFVTVGLI